MDDSTEPALRPSPLTLNRKLPLWYQVAQHLRACILARRQGDPTRLPIEEDLAAHYGISVMTMRAPACLVTRSSSVVSSFCRLVPNCVRSNRRRGSR